MYKIKFRFEVTAKSVALFIFNWSFNYTVDTSLSKIWDLKVSCTEGF